MSDKDKIRQEIERLKTTNPSEYNYNNAEGYIWAMDDILAFIDSLPEEDPLNDPRFGEGFDAGRAVQRIFDETEEKPSEDLEEAANMFAVSYDQGTCDGIAQDCFKAGAKWMASQMPMPEDTVIFMKGVAEGRRLEREEREENKRKEDELPRYYGD